MTAVSLPAVTPRPAVAVSAMRGRLTTAPLVTRLIGVTDLGLAALAIIVAVAYGNPWWQGLPFAVVSAAGAFGFLFCAPAHPDSAAARWQVFPAALKPALACLAVAPDGAALLPLICSTTVFIAFRLHGHRVVAAYIALSIVAVAAVGLLAGSPEMILAVVIAFPAVVAIGIGVGLVMHRVELLAQALDAAAANDPLTGVANRRTLDEVLAYELGRHALAGDALSVLAIDLNGFKALNDHEGHPAGDALLIDVAATLAACVRAGDTVARQGGDEFCLVLPGTGPEQHQAVIELVRRALGQLTLRGESLTAGIGAAAFPAEGETADQLLALADARLYDDKALRKIAR